MNNKFSIGEMSKLHNTSIKTLRYYDEIGLFKPIEVNKNNGYRYYSVEQFEKLNTINYLKFLGIPLKEIKTYLETRNIDYFLELLKKEKDITEDKIKQLMVIKSRFENRIEEIERAQRIKELDVVKIKKIKERKILSLKENIHTKLKLEICLRNLVNRAKIGSAIMIGRVGLTVSIENIRKHKFNEYNSIFILLEENMDNELVKTLKEGEYASIYYRGCDHRESEKYFKIIITYLEKNNYKITGDAVERVIIDQYISKCREDYLTEIQIPVKKH
ncbi:MAG: MerR family transcriptional regulator [Anaeromicrobium sp.]|jgi:effector-binding domain-containing protein|uniref:MerR family transcriptional regulator n=1 Tax=Anaeromicrobium sp. TaxID=1929132 RepID=UPI0025EA3620|nr:MerR family transcriptional regulator [Anaeromicrobium sp.]MCT4592963.1 MerR family transcriptional regulator [Anaeromicrobium sp.]